MNCILIYFENKMFIVNPFPLLQTVKHELHDNYMDVNVEDHPIKVENNMEIGFRKTSPTKIGPLQIVKHEFN